MIYLDYAATAPLRPGAKAAMLEAEDVRANPNAGYGAARHARHVVDEARRTVAECLGALPEEVYFTSGGTEADNWAIVGMASAAGAGHHLVVSAIEHHAVLRPAQTLQRMGFGVSFAAPDEDGVIRPESVMQAVRPQTCLVSVMMANNETGAIQPVAEIAKAAAARGIPIHTDAVQAAGHIPINMRMLGVSLLSLSAHKFGGPMGVGALMIRRGTRIDPLILGGAQERNMRAGTENVPGIAGMAAALRAAEAERAEEAERIARLRDALCAEILACCPDARCNAAGAQRLPGLLHLTFPGVDQAAMLTLLDLSGLAVSAGSACTSGSVERSHVMTAMRAAGGDGADLRLSLGRETTVNETEKAAEIIIKTIRGLRNTA